MDITTNELQTGDLFHTGEMVNRVISVGRKWVTIELTRCMGIVKLPVDTVVQVTR